MTQQAIADEVGDITQRQVSRILDPKGLESKNARQFGWMPKSAEDAAAKIREKFGDAFAEGAAGVRV